MVLFKQTKFWQIQHSWVLIKNTYDSSTELFAKGIAIENGKPIKDLGLLFTSSMTWNCHLKMAEKKGFQTLNHLRRVFPRSSKEIVKCTLTYMFKRKHVFSAVFYASNVWNRGPQYLERLERLQRSCFKGITCSSVLGDKEYVESLIRNRLWPVSYFQVLIDLILLKKNLVVLTSMNGSDHWSQNRLVVQRPDQVKSFLLKREKHFGNVLKIII